MGAHSGGFGNQHRGQDRCHTRGRGVKPVLASLGLRPDEAALDVGLNATWPNLIPQQIPLSPRCPIKKKSWPAADLGGTMRLVLNSAVLELDSVERPGIPNYPGSPSGIATGTRSTTRTETRWERLISGRHLTDAW